MKQLLTPRQVARAFDVSESSVKRWCDKGEIATLYTSGGHRRIALSTVLELVRAGQQLLVNPDALGLPATSGETIRVVDRARDQLIESLVAGEESRCRQIIIDLYLAEHHLSVICDDVLAAAFHEIGERWSCGDVEVYQERRGCQIAERVMQEMSALLPAPLPDAPFALGGTSSGDHYSLATNMVELVLRDSKWNAVSLGDNLPFETLDAAIRQKQPKLFWLSCTFIEDESSFLKGYAKLYEEFGSDIAFVVGGKALTETLRRNMSYSAYCDNMQHLQGFANTLRQALESKAAEQHS